MYQLPVKYHVSRFLPYLCLGICVYANHTVTARKKSNWDTKAGIYNFYCRCAQMLLLLDMNPDDTAITACATVATVNTAGAAAAAIAAAAAAAAARYPRT